MKIREAETRFFILLAVLFMIFFILDKIEGRLTETVGLLEQNVAHLSEVTGLLTPEPIDEQTHCVEVERGEWHEEYGCVLQELQP